MPHDFTEFFPRRPRFSAAANDSLCAAIVRSDAMGAGVLPAELRDFSRGGFSLWLGTPLEDNEQITLELLDEASGYEVSVPGTVRWQIRADDKSWLLGCQACEEIDWTTLGELLLSKVLLPSETGRLTPFGEAAQL